MVKKEMTNDEIKRQKKYYLKGYVRCTNKIKRLENKLEVIDENIKSLKSQEITDMPKGGKPFTIEDMLIKKEETEQRIAKISDYSISVRKEIIDKIDELDDYRHIEVLELFFIEGLTLDEISEREHYSLRHTIRMYSEALRKLEIPIKKDK